jgi:hypothetical protein
MYGTPGITDLATRIPVLDIVVLSRFGIVVSFCAIWLAAQGVHALATEPRSVAVSPLAGAGFIMAGVVAASLIFFRRPLTDAGLLSSTLAWVGFALAIGVATTAVVVSRRREQVSAHAFVTVLSLVLLLDLGVFARGFHPTIERSEVFPGTPEIERVLADPGLFRVGGWQRSLLPNAATFYGLSDYRGYDGIGPRHWWTMLEAALPSGIRQFHELDRPAALRLLRLLNVRYVFGPPGAPLDAPGLVRLDAGPAPLWRDDRAFPRAFLAHGFEVVQSPAELQARLRDPAVDLRRTVIVEEPPLADRRITRAAWPEAAGSVDVRHYRDTFVEMVVRTDAPRMLVLADGFYPGWQATIDDMPARVLRADGGLRAVHVEAGDHVVRFVYEPLSLRLGAGVSGLTALLLAVLWVRRPR